jgi:hypothetical protein
MKTYEKPDNIIELLNGLVRSAAETAFCGPRLTGIPSISTLNEFRAISTTLLSEFRSQKLRDVLGEADKIDWIVGTNGGRSPALAAIAESADEGAIRYDILVDAVKERILLDESTVCVVVSTPDRRYFASEIATILIAAGAQAHVFTDDRRIRVYQRIDIVAPDIVVLMSNGVSDEKLPESVELCITFNREYRVTRFPQLDVYQIDGLGFLGHSADQQTYTLNSDTFYFEQSSDGKLIVTPFYSRVQPALRVQTEDRVELLSQSRMRFI